ncbi:MAG: DUF4397 domain-containing protein [Gemmatimonadales bacterium]
MRVRLTKAGLLSLVAVAAGLGCQRPRDEAADRADDTANVAVGRPDPNDLTMVRFVNAVPSVPKMDVQAGDQAAFDDVNFKDVTPYREIEQNRPEFKAMPADQPAGEPLARNTELVLDGKYYTVIAVPTNDGKGVELATLRDDGEPSDRSKARIRVVHAATRAGDIDVMVNDATDPVVNDMRPGGDADYKEVTAGPATVTIKSKDDGRVLLQMPEVQLAPGESVTIVLTHPSAGSNKVEAIKVADQRRLAGPAN